MSAEDVPCGFCLAKPGDPCTDTRTGKATRSAHPSRASEAKGTEYGYQPDPDFAPHELGVSS